MRHTDTATTWALIGSNGLTLLLAIALKWPLSTLLWPYWAQSMIIGYFSRKRMLALREFSTAGMSMGDPGEPVPETDAGRRSVVRFFTLHYGFFHAGYLVFLLAQSKELAPLDWLGFAVAALVFAWNHRLSFERHVEADTAIRQSLTRMMLLPYLRVVPMHLAIMLGAGLAAGNGPLSAVGALIAFVTLKTGADVAMHYAEHHLLQRASR